MSSRLRRFGAFSSVLHGLGQYLYLIAARICCFKTLSPSLLLAQKCLQIAVLYIPNIGILDKRPYSAISKE